MMKGTIGGGVEEGRKDNTRIKDPQALQLIRLI